MARRKTNTQPPPVEVRQFTNVADIKRGIEKLARRIKDVEGLDPSKVRYNDALVENVSSSIRATISQVFGENSPEVEENEGLLISNVLFPSDTDDEAQENFAGMIPRTVTKLEGLISRLEEEREDLEADQSGTTSSDNSFATSRRVFVVHGRDEAAKGQVRTFLTQLELEPVILDEQPNRGNTIIEKFEKNADVGFAVVLFTPDDTGGLADSSDKSQPRARQNVIFELGFFVGKLGRANVCLLHKGEVEMMSDYYGVIYVPMDDSGGWQLRLARELNSAGIDVDLNRLQ